jgi:hypothetical protein
LAATNGACPAPGRQLEDAAPQRLEVVGDGPALLLGLVRDGRRQVIHDDHAVGEHVDAAHARRECILQPTHQRDVLADVVGDPRATAPVALEELRIAVTWAEQTPARTTRARARPQPTRHPGRPRHRGVGLTTRPVDVEVVDDGRVRHERRSVLVVVRDVGDTTAWLTKGRRRRDSEHTRV